MSDAFTHAGYRALIAAFLERGYQVTDYDDACAEKAHLILRHDLDMSLQAAEPIAEIEHELGVTAYYFVLLRSEMYNPFSAAARRSLDHIQKLGHRIGLHIDAALYGNDPEALDAAAERDCRVLEDATDAPISFVSFHRPAKSLHGYNKKLAGRRHAYEPCFFEAIGYVSDSRGGWHHGHPLEHEVVASGRALQLLTHPIWWPAEVAGGPVERLDRFVAERQDLLRRELAANCEPYRAARQQESEQ